MPNTIYESGNYIVINAESRTFEYPKKFTYYFESSDGKFFGLKRTFGGEFRIILTEVSRGIWEDNNGSAYTSESLRSFLRTKTAE